MENHTSEMVRGIVRPVNFRKELVFELDELKTFRCRDDMPKKSEGQRLLRLLGRILAYARIMVSSILNLVVAFTACGMVAGRLIVSPVRTL